MLKSIKADLPLLNAEEKPSRQLCGSVMFDTIIVRYGGEIGIKGEWTKRAQERQLLKNMKAALKHYRIAYESVERQRGRTYIKTRKTDAAMRKLAKVFGVSSMSPAVQTSSTMKDLVDTCLLVAKKTFKPEQSFAVRCRRVGAHTYSSMDVCREVGRQVLDKLSKLKPRVNLDNPQITINIEVRDEYAFVFTETVRGAGGFPLGSQQKLVGLLSGGIDSPVACWLAMKRGCPIVPVYFDNAPFTDSTTQANAVETAKILSEWAIGFPRKMHVIPHGGTLSEIAKHAPRHLTCVLCKRMMYRVAERIADIEKAEGIVTGEAIGEQASQTIHNLRILDLTATRYPIHRPLLGFDKNETEQLAKKIGTYEASIRKATSCSAVPDKPSTQAKLGDVEKAESLIDIDGMVEVAVRNTKTMNF